MSIRSAVNPVNLVNAVNAVKYAPPLGGVATGHWPLASGQWPVTRSVNEEALE
jgi:hypothetical protein